MRDNPMRYDSGGPALTPGNEKLGAALGELEKCIHQAAEGLGIDVSMSAECCVAETLCAMISMHTSHVHQLIGKMTEINRAISAAREAL